ncbi:hypothetical protein [Streptomyces coelicoflavus]|uniref:hypothetical protein n=1 Tax=Streptomyces coelicoflavus TaxID=285562 RepID=UPI003698CC46
MTAMSGQVWVSLISLGGVVLGGSLSYLVQHRTQLSAERAEQQRQQIALSEARRGERLALLERFIEVSAEAERCAYARPSEWDDTHAWYLTTREVMARFWVADRLIRILIGWRFWTRPARSWGSTPPTSKSVYGTALQEAGSAHQRVLLAQDLNLQRPALGPSPGRPRGPATAANDQQRP